MKESKVMEKSIQALQKYYPVALSELRLYGDGSLLRFSGVITRISSDWGEGWVWFFENKINVICYLTHEMLNRNDALIQELFGKDLPQLYQTIRSLKTAGWRGNTVTLYGQTIFADEEWLHFEAHYFLPQTWQAELEKKRIKPADKLVVNKVSEEQAKDFLQRKEQLGKLFRGEKE
jgi:hypothetical protein